MILVVGHLGNMGRRYRAILDYLGERWLGADVADPEFSMTRMLDYADSSDGVIIASPSKTHLQMAYLLATAGRPILCEKPITNDLDALSRLLGTIGDSHAHLDMVYQYKELDHEGDGETVYDYYKHGGDGLYWDCIQLIGLARGPITLRETSPVWTCKLNGRVLSIAEMDWAYIRMIKNWLANPGQDLDEIYRIHEKVHQMEANARSS